MSTGFNWFKSYKIEKDIDCYMDGEYKIRYIGGGDTSHSSGNIGKVQDLFEKYGDVRIPSICEDWIKSEKEKFDLIEPEIISNICRKILDNKDVDEVGMRERVEWFKKLSDEGYYLSYEYE